MTNLQKIRKAAGVTQNEVAVRAGVSPPTARNFERFGPEAVDDESKRSRLEAVYNAIKSQQAADGERAA
jgi:transcriptional regulator with XRE-family HTH domain